MGRSVTTRAFPWTFENQKVGLDALTRELAAALTGDGLYTDASRGHARHLAPVLLRERRSARVLPAAASLDGGASAAVHFARRRISLASWWAALNWSRHVSVKSCRSVVRAARRGASHHASLRPGSAGAPAPAKGRPIAFRAVSGGWGARFPESLRLLRIPRDDFAMPCSRTNGGLRSDATLPRATATRHDEPSAPARPIPSEPQITDARVTSAQ